MKKSEQIGELTAALAAAQGEMENPVRNRTAIVRMKAGGTYTFSYADLAACLNAVRKPLSSCGLSFTQSLEQHEGGKFRLETILWHATGQFLSSEYPLMVEDAGSQSFGSALSYMRRYALCAMLGIAADDDDDGNAADGNQKREPGKPAPNVLRPPQPATNVVSAAGDSPDAPADAPAPPVSSPDVPDGAGELDTDVIARHDAELTKAAETGDRVALEAAWKLIPPHHRSPTSSVGAALNAALRDRHWPRCREIERTTTTSNQGDEHHG